MEFLYDETKNQFLGLEIIGESHGGAPRDIIINRLDPNDLSIISSTYIETIYDSAAHFIIDPFTKNIIIDTNKASYELNPNTLSINNKWEVTDFSIDSEYTQVYYRNNTIIINDLNKKEVSFFSATNNQIIDSISKDFTGMISDDGKYIAMDNGIFEYVNGNLNLLTSADYKITDITFMPDKNKCVYQTGPYNHVVFDFSNHSESTLINVERIDLISYDKISKSILIGEFHVSDGIRSDISFIHLIEPNNSEIKKLEVYDSHTGHILRYLNGKLIFSGGMYMDEYIISE